MLTIDQHQDGRSASEYEDSFQDVSISSIVSSYARSVIVQSSHRSRAHLWSFHTHYKTEANCYQVNNGYQPNNDFRTMSDSRANDLHGINYIHGSSGAQNFLSYPVSSPSCDHLSPRVHSLET